MWKTWGTTDNVFWDAGTIDKCSKEYLRKMNWKEIDMNLNMNDMYLLQTQCNKKDYGLICLVNDETNEKLFYMLKRVKKFTKDTYNLEYEIDTWTTYNIPLIDSDVEVLVERHQDYSDDRMLEFNDDKIDTLDLNFDDIKKVDYKFKKDLNNKIIFSNNGKKLIYNNIKDVLNGCFCLVINDNDSSDYSPYTFIPILGYSSNIEINTNNIKNNKYEFIHTAKIYSNAADIGTFWYEFNFDKNFINWYYSNVISNKKITVNYEYENKKFDLTNYFKNKRIENIYCMFMGDNKYNKVYFHIYDSKNHLNGGSYNARGLADISYNGELIYSFDFKGNYLINRYGKFIFESDSDEITSYDVLDNSLLNINNIIKSQKYANKINGIYLIPNIFNLTSLWKKKQINGSNVLILDIEQQGNKIDDIVLLNNIKISNEIKFNNEIPMFKIVYRYFKCNWLNSDIDISNFIKDDKLILSGWINFTNSFNIISDNDKYLLDNRLINLPGQQPLKSDIYNKYVQANMNTINTGYAIQKQQSFINGVNGIFSNVLNGVIGSALGGNVLGGITGAGGSINSVVGNVLNIKNFEKQINAKYSDLKNSQGNDLVFSATKDSLWSHLLTNNDHFESVMIKNLTPDSIMRINNTLLLNGVYNPKYFKLYDLPQTTRHLGFYYAKLNTTNFNQVFSKYINESREIKDIILNNFAEFRIWDKVPEIK